MHLSLLCCRMCRLSWKVAPWRGIMLLQPVCINDVFYFDNFGFGQKRKNGHQCIASLCISQLPTVSPALNQGLLSIAMASTIMPVLPLVLVPANSRCLVGMRRLSHGVSSGNNADLELGTVLPTALKFEVNITLTCFLVF